MRRAGNFSGVRYNRSVRLIITIAWCLAALMWTPWALLLVRLLIDLALGTPLSQSDFTAPVLLGIWPGYSWLSWRIVSWYPVSAVLGMIIAALGWRLYWWNENYALSRPGWVVVLSICCPVLCPFIMWRDARRRYFKRQTSLECAVDDARERLQSAS